VQGAKKFLEICGHLREVPARSPLEDSRVFDPPPPKSSGRNLVVRFSYQFRICIRTSRGSMSIPRTEAAAILPNIFNFWNSSGIDGNT
jgi:hypothetical protein